MYEIEIYEDKKGNSEIESYLKKLRNSNSKDERIKSNKIRTYIKALSIHGLGLNEPYIKKLEDEIWELRPLRDRILFTSWCNNKFILLSIFMKKTRKTPRSEIEKAKRLLEDYRKRSEGYE